jgi:hypothetical protein
MAAKRNFDQQLAALDALRQQPEQVRERGLRKAFTHRNNFLVAKAADLVREFQMAQVIPELLVAFDRFFHNPVKTDPQCWAKNALSRSLATLEHQDAGVFLRGMRHIQMEPIWGGRSDTAGTLRATCALALVQGCALSKSALLAHLLELLGDTDKGVRTEVVRAIEQVGSSSAVLLLRLRAVLGADEPEVLGACYSGILCIEGLSAIPWVGRFLASGDECAAESSLGDCRDPFSRRVCGVAGMPRKGQRSMVAFGSALGDRSHAPRGSGGFPARFHPLGIPGRRSCDRGGFASRTLLRSGESTQGKRCWELKTDEGLRATQRAIPLSDEDVFHALKADR